MHLKDIPQIVQLSIPEKILLVEEGNTENHNIP